MRRVVPLLAALILLLGAGLVQGVWTRRWQKSAALEAAVARVKALPTEFGDWRSEEQPVPANELALAGAEAAWVRRFTSPRQPKGILVMLLCGRTNAMCAHQPETCYSGAGFDIAAAPLYYTLHASKGAPLGEFWTGSFVKQDPVDGAQLRIFWSWLADGKWQAPSWPRWFFAGKPYLFKLYVVRDVTVRPEKLEDDPAVSFMRQLLPILTEHLQKD